MIRTVVDPPHRRYSESPTPRIGELGRRRLRVPVRRGVAIRQNFKSCSDFLNLKRLNHAFTGPLCQKISQGCNELSLLVYLEIWREDFLKAVLSKPQYHRGVIFRLRISPLIRSQNRTGSKGSVRDQCRTDLCKKKSKKPVYCHVSLSEVKYLIIRPWSTVWPGPWQHRQQQSPHRRKTFSWTTRS